MRKEYTFRMNEHLLAVAKIMQLNLGRECDKIVLQKLQDQYHLGKPTPDRIKEFIIKYLEEQKAEIEIELLKFTEKNPYEFTDSQVFNLLNDSIPREKAGPLWDAYKAGNYPELYSLILSLVNSGKLNEKILDAHKETVVQLITAKEKQRVYHASR